MPMARPGEAPTRDPNRVLVLDFGSQTTQLIARRVREAHVYCEILPCTAPMDELRAWAPAAVILSGGPASVHDPGHPEPASEVLDLGVPVLGICYGAQWMTQALGGEVSSSDTREFGRAYLHTGPHTGPHTGIDTGPHTEPHTEPDTAVAALAPSRSDGAVEAHDDGLMAAVRAARNEANAPPVVWMSHSDRIAHPAPGFVVTARTDASVTAAVEDPQRRLYGVQFHPEVVHTEVGVALIRAFLYDLAGLQGTWDMASFAEEAVATIAAKVGPAERVILGLSGGVDSSVAALLLHRALGDRLQCIFVDNGLLRLDEAQEVVRTFRDHYHLPLRAVDARDRFLEALRGVEDPEEKRRRIGHAFVEVFQAEARTIHGARWLAQGTLYPDVIESVSFRGPSATIKTHHNVGGLPPDMELGLIEPLRELFKDEVRALGVELGLPEAMVWRQPFPGPGMAVRILGEVTPARVALLQRADAIVRAELDVLPDARDIWQYFAVLLPIRTVGVMGDRRTYEHVVAIRAVTSTDGMTADWAPLGRDVLARMSNRIINEVQGVNRVVYDISSKPPATIEWE